MKINKLIQWKIVLPLIVLIAGCSDAGDNARIANIAASSTLENSDKYGAANLRGNPAASWCEGSATEGIGEKITFDLVNGSTNVLFIQNGFHSAQYFNSNNRVKDLKVSQDDFSQTVTLADNSSLQKINLSQDLQTGPVTLTILSVYKGTKWNDTCLTSVSLKEKPATGIESAKKDSNGYLVELTGRGPGEPGGTIKLCPDNIAEGSYSEATDGGLDSYRKKCKAVSWSKSGDTIILVSKCATDYLSDEYAPQSTSGVEEKMELSVSSPAVSTASFQDCKSTAMSESKEPDLSGRKICKGAAVDDKTRFDATLLPNGSLKGTGSTSGLRGLLNFTGGTWKVSNGKLELKTNFSGELYSADGSGNKETASQTFDYSVSIKELKEINGCLYIQ